MSPPSDLSPSPVVHGDGGSKVLGLRGQISNSDVGWAFINFGRQWVLIRHLFSVSETSHLITLHRFTPSPKGTNVVICARCGSKIGPSCVEFESCFWDITIDTLVYLFCRKFFQSKNTCDGVK